MSGVLLKSVLEQSREQIERGLDDVRNAVLCYGDDEFKDLLEELIARKQEVSRTIEQLIEFSEDM